MGGNKRLWRRFNTGAKTFNHTGGGLGGGLQKVLPCLEGGAQNVLNPRFFQFVAPHSPVFNYQSLNERNPR